MTIVLAADDHEYDSVVRLWPRCKVTFETLPVALSTRACRFLLLHFGNARHAKSTSFKAFQTKTSKLTLKLNKNQRRKAWYLRHFRKNLTKKTKNYLNK